MAEFKKDCGFKEKVYCCSFKPEQCNAEDCDMYNIEWDKDTIKKKLDDEREALKDMVKRKKKLKKEGDKKSFKEIAKEMADKVYGIMYLSKAYDHLCGGKFSKMRDNRVARRLANKVKKQSEKT